MAKNENHVLIILCALGLIGIAGIHRLYSKKVVSGIVWLLTAGLFGIGTLLDLFLLITAKKMLLEK